jgi:hypothetical protein
MFALTTLVYPVLLGALCLGAGLLVDRLSGAFLPAPLLLPVGAAALIAASQLTTYLHAIAPATPYVIAAIALAGLAVARGRVATLARRTRERPWPVLASLLAYAIALAPVLLAGRPTFSSYMALADSAVHMMGADFLMRHGQDYGHLDLRNSYGQFINDYYNAGYPTGADTLFGGSAFMLRLPLIWAFQPFNAFLLATATGPAWMLARRMRLDGVLAALAALTAVLPALVYGYELLGSVKEIAALTMILTLGCLVVLHRHWLNGGAARAIPFGLVAAAGLSALGAAFGAWAVAAVAVLAVIAVCDLLAGRHRPGRLALTAAGGALTLFICALPSWIHVSNSLRVAQNIASTGNPGNLHTPLRTIQVFGVWLRSSYKLAPTGAALALTHALVVLMLLAALLGAAHLLRTRAYALAGWLACMLLAWLAVSESVTTWAGAKTLMLTSPVVVLLAWGAIAALWAASPRAPARAAAALGALAIAAGVLVSDALQYHGSNLAPTARYSELAAVNSRFAGLGPTLFTDFDEYSLYELRDMDVGGPDFVYPPAALAGLAGGYGQPVHLDRASPEALLAYPVIVTRRDPTVPRPPAAYRLLWEGAFYQVWRRTAGAGPAIDHRVLGGTPVADCRRINREVQVARGFLRSDLPGARLVAAPAPEIVSISLASSPHPAPWGHQRQGLVMSVPGRLSAAFRLPHAGPWEVWIQGQLMPTVKLALDGRPLASLGGQLSGNSLVPDTLPPLALRLSAGPHSLTVTRPAGTLAPGDGGSAVLSAIFLTPAGAGGSELISTTPLAGPRVLCPHRLRWVELLGG